MRHVALFVDSLEACEQFYVQLLGMEVEWRPDADNVYLTGGNDNLALHRALAPVGDDRSQRLDHIGFILAKIEHVDSWHDFLVAADVVIIAEPRTHRDGARSFYCVDPAGTRVQMIWHPPLAG
ncbi:MAG: VOC family protein [Gammaproteobacteria bacterium]|nr:MAG: VOC family protein [Gammaproteobacteria bacterium]RLA16110.1 MAG: VOC family protein [Gammaproteobacteria bacterium]